MIVWQINLILLIFKLNSHIFLVQNDFMINRKRERGNLPVSACSAYPVDIHRASPRAMVCTPKRNELQSDRLWPNLVGMWGNVVWFGESEKLWFMENITSLLWLQISSEILPLRLSLGSRMGYLFTTFPLTDSLTFLCFLRQTSSSRTIAHSFGLKYSLQCLWL